MANATYWIARHIDDLLRDEPINIGVIVDKDGERAGVFLGESEPGRVNRHKLRKVLNHTDVYSQWIKYWRSQFPKGFHENAIALGRDHYRLITGGEVTGTTGDSAQDIANYLYTRLVKVPSEKESDSKPSKLDEDVYNALEISDLVQPRDGLRYPVRPDEVVDGQKTPHEVDFAQKNGDVRSVIECIDLERKAWRSKEHANATAYTFLDIGEKHPECHRIAIIRKSREMEREVQWGFDAVKAEASRLVDWYDTDDVEALIIQLKQISISGS